MGNERSGLVTALELLGASGQPDDQANGHDDLFGDDFEAAANLTLSQRAQSPRGGRPAGAKNKSTEAWRSYWLSRYRSPLIGLGEMTNRTPKELAEELGLYERVPTGDGGYEDRLATGKAAQMQLDAMKALLPYVHQQQPRAIELPPNVMAPILVIGHLVGDDGMTPDGQIPFANDDDYQSVIDVTPTKSDADKSDDGQ